MSGSAEQEQHQGTALARLSQGQIMGFATETVWGLGCLPPYIGRLSERKGRDQTQAFQASCPSGRAALALAQPSPRLEALSSFWPGPLTLIAPASALCPPALAPLGWVGLRVPAAPALSRLLQSCGPLATTSLNPTGQPPATNQQQALAYGLADFLLPDEENGKRDLAAGLASTVVRVPALREQPLEVLRSGAITLPDLMEHLRERGL